ncbi:Heat shock protein Hsp-12.2 [Aphelenchoides fujianensis]|nr:Heat shock protein Hsp-12.2 [Aphelenchoides fujianensis]
MSNIPLTHDEAGLLDWPLQHNDGVVKVHSTADKWEIGLDASFFTPREIEVKVVGDQLVVHFLHEERTDQHGTVKREINRSYHLPADVDPSTLKSHLTARGVLQISAGKKK